MEEEMIRQYLREQEDALEKETVRRLVEENCDSGLVEAALWRKQNMKLGTLLSHPSSSSLKKEKELFGTNSISIDIMPPFFDDDDYEDKEFGDAFFDTP